MEHRSTRIMAGTRWENNRSYARAVVTVIVQILGIFYVLPLAEGIKSSKCTFNTFQLLNGFFYAFCNDEHIVRINFGTQK